MNTSISDITIAEYPLLKSGKVREVYDLGQNLLFVATDRVSAYDSILPTPIPDKGKVLTQLSVFWFNHFSDVVDNHYISDTIGEYYPDLKKYEKQLEGRSMLVKKAEVIPVECVVRGYLAGSGWAEYRQNGTVCGDPLPEGLRESSELPEPIFTPATKAESGHDENISFERMKEIIDPAIAQKLHDISITLYNRAREYARKRGIIIADTKFEFGMIDNEILLIDEVFTPDSSRFWPADQYQPGKSQPSFDKQIVRDYLTGAGWDREPPAPELPAEIVEKTREKYIQVLKLLLEKN
jgi:phosphoribosylaminoimidazole-succinocarboxamide synthase